MTIQPIGYTEGYLEGLRFAGDREKMDHVSWAFYYAVGTNEWCDPDDKEAIAKVALRREHELSYCMGLHDGVRRRDPVVVDRESLDGHASFICSCQKRWEQRTATQQRPENHWNFEAAAAEPATTVCTHQLSAETYERLREFGAAKAAEKARRDAAPT